MARRAVECFRAQTYENKRLLVYDTGKEQPDIDGLRDNETHFRCFWGTHRGMLSIGTLRNEANGHSDDMPHDPDILIHWDDDDWSHQNRITEQVALLEASGADAVGYNELLFWRNGAEAWLYTNRNQYYAVGTSLCYWRKTWECKPFADLPRPEEWKGEDKRWIQDLKVVTDSGMGPAPRTYREPPRLIARIHGGNTMRYDIEWQIKQGSQEWRRVPEFDRYCREKMSL